MRSLDVVRSLAAIALVHALFEAGSVGRRVAAIRLVTGTLAFVCTLQIVAAIPAALALSSGPFDELALRLDRILRSLVAIGALTLLHELNLRLDEGARERLRWTIGTLTLFWGVELGVHAVAWAAGSLGWAFEIVRTAVAAILAFALVAEAGRARSISAFEPRWSGR